MSFAFEKTDDDNLEELKARFNRKMVLVNQLIQSSEGEIVEAMNHNMFSEDYSQDFTKIMYEKVVEEAFKTVEDLTERECRKMISQLVDENEE